MIKILIEESAREYILQKGGKVTVYTTIYPGC